MTEDSGHRSPCGRAVMLFDCIDDIEMPGNVGRNRSRIDPGQAEVPEARRVVVQQHELPLDLPVLARRRHGAMKNLIHAHQPPEITLPYRLDITVERCAHGGDFVG